MKNLAFLAFPEQAELLISELAGRFGITQKPEARYGDLLYFENLALPEGQFPYWTRTVMLEPFFVKFNSIGEAAAELKKLQRNWAPYQYTCFRRAQLIQEKLPYINLKERSFPVEIPNSPMGLYTLIDEHTMIASAATTSTLPAGTLHFIEDHENPPSRAYLKIQESLTMANLLNGTELPHEGQRCFEAGACPGGWTWVLVQQGCKVYAVDRSPLDQRLMDNQLVEFHKHDAFTLLPEELGEFDWICSDVICYPERLLEWIHRWLDSGLCKNMVCTIKMQGEIDWKLIQEFEAIPNSRIFHLHYNKHELTWIHCH